MTAWTTHLGNRLRSALVGMLLACMGSWAVPALAAEAQSTAADPVLEARVNKLSAELRCLVCQNQTIADSHADLATDLKNQVRDQLRAGRSEQQVIDYMTQRYGDFVLYRPPVRGTTALLWFGPAVLLVGGVLVLVLVLRRRSRMAAEHFEPDEDDEAGDSAQAAPGVPSPSAAPPGAPSR